MKRKIVAAISVGLLLVTSLFEVLFTSKPPATPYDDILAEEPVQFALQFFSWLKAKDWAAIKSVSDSSLLNADTERTFDIMANMIPPVEPTAIHLIAYAWTKSSSKPERDTVTLEYNYPGQSLLAYIVVDRSGNSFVVMGASLTPIVQPLEQYYETHFLGQSRTHYVVAATAVVLMILNLYALARCIVMQELRRKWLWIIFILFGLGSIEFDWTEGTFNINPLFVAMPIVRFAQSAYQPFIIELSVPIGTFVFLMRRRSHPRDPTVAQFE